VDENSTNRKRLKIVPTKKDPMRSCSGVSIVR
jgi:hypothetical protein